MVKRGERNSIKRLLATVVIVVSVAVPVFATTAPGRTANECLPPHCFVGTQVVVSRTSVHDDPDRFSISVSGRLDAPPECVRHRRVMLFFKRQGHRPHEQDAVMTRRHSTWFLDHAFQKSPPFVAFVRVARKPIKRHDRSEVCANDGLGVYNRRFPPSP